MNFKRALLILTALILAPTLVTAQVINPTPAPGTALFIVQGDFVDGNSTLEMTFRLSCSGGFPLDQEKTVNADTSGGYGPEGTFEVAFTLDNIPETEDDDIADDVECFVTMDSLARRGYESFYSCDFSDSQPASACLGPPFGNTVQECQYNDVERDNVNYCTIRNVPLPVELEVTKEWVIPPGFAPDSDVDQTVRIGLVCDSEIVGGTTIPTSGDWRRFELIPEGAYVGNEASVTFSVIPNYPSTNCTASENVQDSFVETENGCQDISVRAGRDRDCTITNTIFFEGIPTLSQYGMAIMALLMLGVGFIGFRRFI